ncbi:hypothetical protein BMS3Abin15_00445 [bacterium BMS3Abin15]|nr:hypothetical protein BMS3Abin15_00445 [bacterium BMS3Abin15]
MGNRGNGKKIQVVARYKGEGYSLLQSKSKRRKKEDLC